MKVHFIAIGGSAMHNLAIALHKKGYEITGSDDEIFEPSRSHLENHGILPEKQGWFPEKISTGLDAVILGMHARIDNPELIRAQELGLRIYSYPEYIYEQCRNKERIVIGGSHGKTTITSMIMHVFRYHNIEHDYMVGAQLEGFDTMVSLSENAPVAVFEGDEYLSSPIDRRPKFHRYHPHIALISGIAWDHINVFPTFKEYIDQFRIFAEMTDPEGILIYCDCDETLVKMIHTGNIKACKIPYSTHPAVTRDGVTFLQTVTGDVPIRVFGDHNLQNISGAKIVCNEAGIGDEKFYEAISTFKGASKRLQLLSSNKHTSIFLDFAHSPSKLKATTTAVKKQYPDRRLVACMELHTFSSLNEHFLEHYNGSMASADTAFIYFNPETIRHKKLKKITPQQVHKAFGEGNIEVFTDKDALTGRLLSTDWQGKNLLLMSSGNFSGIDFQEFAGKIIGEK